MKKNSNGSGITQKLVDIIKLIPDKHLQVEAFEDAKMYWEKINENNPCLKYKIPNEHKEYFRCRDELKHETYTYIYDKYRTFIKLIDISKPCSSLD